jgi:hypothetical protein
MRELLIGGAVTALAFAVGISGAPSAVFSGATNWLEDHASLELEGPVGDAVRVAFPELDTGDAAADGTADAATDPAPGS